MKQVLNFALWLFFVVWNLPFLLILLMMSMVHWDHKYFNIISNKFCDIHHAINGVNSHLD